MRLLPKHISLPINYQIKRYNEIQNDQRHYVYMIKTVGISPFCVRIIC